MVARDGIEPPTLAFFRLPSHESGFDCHDQYTTILVANDLALPGSHQGAAAHLGSVCEQLRGTAGDRRDPLPCTLNTIVMRAISDDRWNLPAT